jgi:hypothetical protein
MGGIPAFCPRCGEASDLLALLPDESCTVRSIACATCRGKQHGPPIVDLSGMKLAACARCGTPIWTNWTFCVGCAVRLTLPS